MPLALLTKDLPRLKPFAFRRLRPARPLGWLPDCYPGWHSTAAVEPLQAEEELSVLTYTGYQYASQSR